MGDQLHKMLCAAALLLILNMLYFICHKALVSQEPRPIAAENNYLNRKLNVHSRPHDLPSIITESMHKSMFSNNRLVDLPKISAKSMHTIKFSSNMTAKSIHKIMFYNKPTWINLEYGNNLLRSDCSYGNCELVRKSNTTSDCSAIVFSTVGYLPSYPPISPLKRPRNQVWIFFGMESPANHHAQWYQNPSWRNTMNWSMNYRLDSDIFRPVQLLETRPFPRKQNYSQIFREKSKFAAWVVSNCNTQSKRNAYVERLTELGIQVDIFGGCSRNKTRVDENEITNIIDKQYKFYLGFENSLCKDYVTEKFFKYFGLNTIVVVRGGADYDGLLPNDSFVNTARFHSIERLAEYMLLVGSNETLYTNYLSNKDRYKPNRVAAHSYSFCSICDKLNNLDDNRKAYEDIAVYIHKGMCYPPTDLPTRT